MARQPIAPASDERRSQQRGYALAASAVLLFSTSPVLTRVAGTISSLEIAWWRLFLAALTVLVIATVSRHRVRWQPLVSRRFALYGLIIALHFFFYIASLSFTTVAHSLALVYTAPVFIALLSRVVLKEGLTPSKWAGCGAGSDRRGRTRRCRAGHPASRAAWRHAGHRVGADVRRVFGRRAVGTRALPALRLRRRGL